MKKYIFIILSMILTSLPFTLQGEGEIEFFSPLPLQYSLPRSQRSATTQVYAEDIDTIIHPLVGSQNFKPSDNHQITILEEGREYKIDVADFVLTPGHPLVKTEEIGGFVLDDAKIGSFDISQLVYDKTRGIYIADVRNVMDDEDSIVPDLIYVNGTRKPYDNVYPNIPSNIPAYSLAVVPATDDIVLITHDAVSFQTEEGEEIVYSSPIFYLGRTNESQIYNLKGALASSDTERLRNIRAVDIEVLNLNGDAIPDIAVVNRGTLESAENSYTLFFTGKSSSWTNINNAFTWPESAHTSGRAVFDASVMSDKVGDEWRDAFIVPSFYKINGEYLAYKFYYRGDTLVKNPLFLGTPNFISNNCTSEDRCGPVRIDCTRFKLFNNIHDLNNDGCGDCAVTWGKLIEPETGNPYLELFNGFTVHISRSDDEICSDSLQIKQFSPINALLPSLEYRDPYSSELNGIPKAKAFAIEIAKVDFEDDFLDIIVGDQSLYMDPKRDKIDTLIYIYRSRIDSETGNWDLLDSALDIKTQIANYSALHVNLNSPTGGGGVKSIVADPFRNISLINGYPFIPPVAIEPPPEEGCPANIECSDRTVISYNENLILFQGTEHARYNDKNNNCFPECRFDSAQTPVVIEPNALVDFQEGMTTGTPKSEIFIINQCDPEIDDITPSVSCGCDFSTFGRCTTFDGSEGRHFQTPSRPADVSENAQFIYGSFTNGNREDVDMNRNCIPDCVRLKQQWIRCDADVNNPRCPESDITPPPPDPNRCTGYPGQDIARLDNYNCLYYVPEYPAFSGPLTAQLIENNIEVSFQTKDNNGNCIPDCWPNPNNPDELRVCDPEFADNPEYCSGEVITELPDCSALFPDGDWHFCCRDHFPDGGPRQCEITQSETYQWGDLDKEFNGKYNSTPDCKAKCDIDHMINSESPEPTDNSISGYKCSFIDGKLPTCCAQGIHSCEFDPSMTFFTPEASLTRRTHLFGIERPRPMIDVDADCIPDCTPGGDRCDSALECEEYHEAADDCDSYRVEPGRRRSAPNCDDPRYAPQSSLTDKVVDNLIALLDIVIRDASAAKQVDIPSGGGMHGTFPDNTDRPTLSEAVILLNKFFKEPQPGRCPVQNNLECPIGDGTYNSISEEPPADEAPRWNKDNDCIPDCLKVNEDTKIICDDDIDDNPNNFTAEQELCGIEPGGGPGPGETPVEPTLQKCTIDIDREELPDDEYKKWRKRVRALNDRFRVATGLSVDIFLPEYVGRYEATIYRPLADLNKLPNGANASILSPLYQLSGMEVKNYQGMRYRPVWTENIVRREEPVILLPNASLTESANFPELPSISFAPDTSVKVEGESRFVIDEVMTVSFETVPGGVYKDLSTDLAVASPLKIVQTGIAGVDGCAWSVERCPTQVPPDSVRGLNPEAVIETARQVAGEWDEAGRARSPAMIKEILERTPWDSTGYLEQRFSFVPPDLASVSESAQKDFLLSKAASLESSTLFTPEEEEAITRNITFAINSGAGCDGVVFAVTPMQMEARGGGGCSCNMGINKPSPFDYITYLSVILSIGALIILRVRRKKFFR